MNPDFVEVFYRRRHSFCFETIFKKIFRNLFSVILFLFRSDLFREGPRLNSTLDARGPAISKRTAWNHGPSWVITWLVRGFAASSYLPESADPREWSRDQNCQFYWHFGWNLLSDPITLYGLASYLPICPEKRHFLNTLLVLFIW